MGNEHEEVIDTKSGFAYLLVKWRVILLAALVMGLLGGVFGVERARAEVVAVADGGHAAAGLFGALIGFGTFKAAQSSNSAHFFCSKSKRRQFLYIFRQR